MVTLYDRQREIGLTLPPSLTIAGVGGIGGSVAILSAMAGIENLYLFDPDIMEEHNRNRLPFCLASVNRPKVDVVKEYILSIRPEAVVVAVPEKLEGILLSIQLSVSYFIIDCTDSPRAQFNIYTACKKQGVRFIRAGYDFDREKQDFHITVTSNVSGWIRTDVEEENYATEPSYVVPAYLAAVLTVEKMLRRPSQEISLYLSEIGIPILERQRRMTARCRQTGNTSTVNRLGATRIRRR